MKSTRLITLCLISLLAGCTWLGKRPEQPLPTPTLEYEWIWVEPGIAYVDSLMTLIKAERVDSIAVDPLDTVDPQSVSVEFAIQQPVCNVAVNLFDSEHNLLSPLIVRKLATGFYRLTVNTDRFKDPALSPGLYFLRADICDRSNVTPFEVH